MKVSCPFSCVLLLSFGVCFPPDHGKALRAPAGTTGVMPKKLGLLPASGMAQRYRCPQELCSYFPKRLLGLGKEKAALRSRFQRQEGLRGPENEESVNYLPEDGEKRAGALGSLAEELSGYHRKKGGFSFRFGRSKKIDLCF